jgi:flagella basal body P-ring formation protein FlgA
MTTRVHRRVARGWVRLRVVAFFALLAGAIATDPPGLNAQVVSGRVPDADPSVQPTAVAMGASTAIDPAAASANPAAANPETTATSSGRAGRDPDPGPAAARDLPRGITLTEADIVRGGDPALTATNADGVGEGWVTRRLIAAGEPLRRPAVAPPVWVVTGESVQVLYRVGSVEARLRGTAMGSASKDERVLVRIDTRRRVEGVAVAPGLVNFQGEIR